MTVYDFTVKRNTGENVSLDAYKGQVLLIVNTATQCGLTPQYKDLEALYETYHDRGFEILDFPCNQFKGQAPGSDDEIQQFCTLNYGTKFPRFAKIDVNGESADPLYVWLKDEAPEDAHAGEFETMIEGVQPKETPSDIAWNFCKFLIDRQGNVAGRFAPGYTPDNLAPDIERLLAR